MKIKLTWKAEASGEDEIDLEEWEISDEEWNAMPETERLEILQGYTDENYDAVAYGIVTSYIKIED